MTETDPGILYCANHPTRETNLRCNRCNKPICVQCAVLTPTGYRCKECVRGQQKGFETARWIDYPLAVIISGGLAYLGSLIAGVLGFFTIFVAPVAGVVTAEAVRWVVRRRRSKRLFQAAAAGAILGTLPAIVLLSLRTFLGIADGVALMALLPLLYQVVYAFLMVSTLYYRLAGIRMG